MTKDGVILTVDAANQLVSDTTGATYSYDAAGRLTSVREADGTLRTLAYDGRGLLVLETTTAPGGGGGFTGDNICDSATPTMEGTPGDDVMVGTDGN